MQQSRRAPQGGVKEVLIPHDNWLDTFSSLADIDVTPVRDLEEVLGCVLVKE